MIFIKATSDELAQVLDVTVNLTVALECVSTMDEVRSRCVLFLNKQPSPQQLEQVARCTDCLVFYRKGLAIGELTSTSIVSEVDDAREAMGRIVSWLATNNRVISQSLEPQIAPSAVISPLASIAAEVSIGDGVVIEPFCFIGPRVVIGERTLIRTGAKIVKDVKVGRNCVIRENSVIGGDGFGFVKDDNGRYMRIPHLGGVIIGDDVEIGALNTVCSGTLSPTVIRSGVKTDDHVHIAHNVSVGNDVVATAGAIVSGSVVIGDSVWIGPNAAVVDGVRIGSSSFIGIGSVVTKPVQDQVTVAGNPARPLAEIKARSEAIAEVLRRTSDDR